MQMQITENTRTYKGFVLHHDAKFTSDMRGRVNTLDKPLSATPPNYINRYVSAKIAKDLQCSDEASVQLLKDVSNLLWMSSKSQEVLVPSHVIDEAWHIFILFSEQYAAFCDKYCGGYVHHRPHTGEERFIGLENISSTVDLVCQHLKSKPSVNWDYVPLSTWQTVHSQQRKSVIH